MNTLIVCICAMLFVVFLAFVVYCTWKPRPDDPVVEASPGRDGTTATSRAEADSEARGRDSGVGCRLPFFRRQTSLERNTVPLVSVPTVQHPRNDAD
jgi:hypothetical protein